MKRYILPLAALTVLTLSACGKSEPEVVGGVPDPMGNQLANATKVVLPPSVKASRTYRCKDNSLIYVDFMSDDMSANIRTEKNGAPTALKAEAKGDPFKAEGFAIVGSGDTVSITVPGKGSQSCSN